jgi:hypothetical protein
MCTVLFIIMILLGVSMPAIQSAFVEQAVRIDSRQLALMVRTAMLQSSEQHRPYVIDLTATTIDLHPLDPSKKEVDGNSTVDTDSDSKVSADGVEISHQMDHPTHLEVRDIKKVDAWVAMPTTSWVFQPGALCPSSQVRLARNDSWVELNFNALTGDVENEASYFP